MLASQIRGMALNKQTFNCETCIHIALKLMYSYISDGKPRTKANIFLQFVARYTV